MAIDGFNFRLNGNTYTLPVTGNSNVGTYGSLVYRLGNYTGNAYLAPYKDTAKTVVYSNGMRRYYYSANYPSIHCRKNNTNYSCCNNYQDYSTSLWIFDYAYTGSYSKTVHYAENSYLGSSYNKYSYQTQLAPYGMVTPTRSGYTFKGWNTSPDDKGTAYKSTSKMRSTYSDATFYALWAKIDAGTYSSSDFLTKMNSWFGHSGDNTYISNSKISNHAATITIRSTSVSVKVGSTIQLYFHKDQQTFVTTVRWGITIDGTEYRIAWYNSIGNSGNSNVTISNGWLTDKYSPDIAKGTYSPSSFKNLISQFISVNGSRTVAQSFTATVNGTSVTVPAGGTIYYMHPYSNPDTYLVGFGTKDNYNLYNVAQHSFSTDKTYCVYSSGGILSEYSHFSITITSEIKFN